jgi:S1-C subfamily serine protease
VPAEWTACRVCGTAIAEPSGGQSSSPNRALIAVIAGVIVVVAAVIVMGLSKQGYIGGHSAKIVSEEDRATNVRFHEQAVAVEITDAGKQEHAALQELNRLNLESSVTDLAKRTEQIPAIVAAIDKYEAGLGRLRADAQKALDEKQYSSEKDGHKLETMLTVMGVRKKICSVQRRVADKFLLAKTNAYQVGGRGQTYYSVLEEYVEEMNSEIDYLNHEADELLRIEEENPGATPVVVPGVLEVGEFTESYMNAHGRGPLSALPPPGTTPATDPKGTSRGFVITPDGIAVIRLEPLLHNSRIQVRLADRRLFTVIYVLAFDAENDIAVVRLGRPVAEFANWPEDLPSFSLEQEGAAHAGDSAAIQLENYRVNVSLIPDATPGRMDTILLNGTPVADKIALNVNYCGAPVVNPAGDVIGTLCARSQFYNASKPKPNLPEHTPVVPAGVIRILLTQDLGMEPGRFLAYMLKEHPETTSRYAFHY